MTYKPSEKASVENPCVKYAKDLGCNKVLKVNPLWAAGWQDRIFFVPGGKPLIIEFKRPGGVTSPLQEKRHEELLLLGYDHHVIDNKDEGKALIRARMETAAVHAPRPAVGSGTPMRRAVTRSRAKKD